MFDWNDEELTNIIWDEAGEGDDRIVSFPEDSENFCKKKEWSQAGTNKSTEQKSSGANVEIHGRKLESSSNFDTSEGTSASGFDVDSWPNLSVSNVTKTHQESLNTSVSNNLTETTMYDSSRGDTAQLDKNSEIFQNSNEGKEHSDFVDYGWANIGSFDDLDRIFSNDNDDPIFGNVSLGNADEIWSSKDITNSPVKSIPISADSPSLGLGALRNTSEPFGIKTDYVQEDDLPFSLGYGKVSDPASHGLQNARTVLDDVEYAGGKTKPIMKEQTDLNITGQNTAASNSQLTAENITAPNQSADKAYKQKKLLKNRKKLEEKVELKMYPDLYGNWSPSGHMAGQFKNQFVPPIMQSSASSVLTQQQQIQGRELLPYQQIPIPFVAPSAYGGITNPYSAMPVLSHIQSGELNRQPLLSGYDVSSCNANPVKKLPNSPAKPQTMTPQEKIEKLRRQQQLQAMLAIQKQRQQFGHKVSCSDQPTQKCSQENQIQHFEGSDLEVEDLSVLPSFDPNSPIEQGDSNMISLTVNDYSVEDRILCRLQDIIAKLDVRIRLCIRDSLFRLAQSAMQRHYASDTSSTNNSSRDEQVFIKEEAINHSRNAKMHEVETDTNPIDRTVAHLLFHSPLEFSGKHPDTPESPVSTKLPREHKAVGITKLSTRGLPENMKNKHNFPQQASKSSCPLADSRPVSQCKSSRCLDTSENASNTGPADEGAREVEASK